MHRLLIVVIAAASALSAFGQQAVAAQDKQDKQDKPLPVTFSLTGNEMYKTWCATCHGVIGRGDGPTASELKTHPADLTRLAKKNGGKFPTEKVRTYIDGTVPDVESLQVK
jgi:mono/diheme cytochrome c family protein